MLGDATIRHRAFFDPESFKGRRITIAGAGATSSWSALLFAKMGIEHITICDTDTVSIENIGPSLYGLEHIGRNKAEACAEIVERLSCGVKIQGLSRRIEDVDDYGDALLLGVDLMRVREVVVHRRPRTHIFDPRLALRFYMVLSIDPRDDKDRDMWDAYYFKDEDAVPVPGCGGRPGASPTTVLQLVGDIGDMFVEWWDCVTGKRRTMTKLLHHDLDRHEKERSTGPLLCSRELLDNDIALHHPDA